MRASKRDQLAEVDGEMLVFEPEALDAAIIGYVENPSARMACYSFEKLVQCFVKEGMSEDSAVEHIGYNVAGADVGSTGPVILYPVEGEGEG